MDDNMESQKITKRSFETTDSSTLTSRIVEAISDHTEVDELHPDFLLYEEINIESLNGLVCDRSPSNLQIRFQVQDVTVRVEQDGETEFTIEIMDSERNTRNT